MERNLQVLAALVPDTERGGYVAHAVGVDVACWGGTVEAAAANLRCALEAHFEDHHAPPPPCPVYVTTVEIHLTA